MITISFHNASPPPKGVRTSCELWDNLATFHIHKTSRLYFEGYWREYHILTKTCRPTMRYPDESLLGTPHKTCGDAVVGYLEDPVKAAGGCPESWTRLPTSEIQFLCRHALRGHVAYLHAALTILPKWATNVTIFYDNLESAFCCDDRKVFGPPSETAPIWVIDTLKYIGGVLEEPAGQKLTEWDHLRLSLDLV